MHDGGPILAARVHGGLHEPELRALSLRSHEVLDFSVSTNPYGPALEVVRAISGAAIDRYPDPHATRAREAIAALLALAPEQVLLGQGAAELLWSAARALLATGDTALIVEPTFGEFRAAVLAIGARACSWIAEERDGFAIDLDAVAAAAIRAHACVVYLCTPNTPAGTAVDIDDVIRVAFLQPRITWIVDQSFLSLSTRFADAARSLPHNLLRVCSLTKDHAQPGVRVGYATGPRALLQRIDAQRSAWSTSAHAQLGAEAACANQAFVAESRAKLLADCARTAAGLRALGLDPIASSTVFLIVRVGDAAALRGQLLAHSRILVRDCASFGLPAFIRIAARPEHQSERLIAALAELLP
jgi:histidinol-phosphate/aromatic aminotransferase/cobyric acid decarboxylase-like protein